ncbi:MAG: RNA-directed DNA polymerase [Schwartzia sp.]|nr:RNA-directed DNA polymerase [Schwartzia sp. (in: firmicutes)]
MTGNEKRREARCQRRKAKREAKKRAECSAFDDFGRIVSYDALYQANRKSKSGVTWKASVQRYQMHLLKNIEKTKRALEAGKDVTKGFVEFDVIERGKRRHIRSVHFSERVVQRSLCDNALVPMLRRGLIYDNGACLPGRGVDQALDRFAAHLQRFYRRNGNSNEGWAVIFDFSKFFDTIRHDYCFEMYRKAFRDERILWLLSCFVVPFGLPGAKESFRRQKARDTAGYSGVSLGLGSHISQITAVAYPSAIDHYIKERLRVRGYGRYMDDGYMLFRTKGEAKRALEILAGLCERYGIVLNRKKTHIAKIQHGLRFLKVKMTLTSTGKVVRRMARTSIVRQRRKLKSFARKIAAGKMAVQDAATSHASWKGHALKRGGIMAARKMDKLFEKLFGAKAPECKIKKRRKRQWLKKKSCRKKNSRA